MRFLRPTAAAKPPPTPESQRAEARRPVRKNRLRPWQVSLAVTAVPIALIAVAALFRPPPAPLSQQQFNGAVEAYLQKRPAAPTAANVAFARIFRALVQIQTYDTDPALAGGSPSTPNNPEKRHSLGTGFVVEENGTVMTALHVVSSGSFIRVRFSNGDETDATVMGTQPDNDIALLKPSVIPDDLQPATFGNSAGLRVGDEVVAVGNPFGITASASQGVVSGLGRTMPNQETGITLKNLIQFDAAVNPGNSGGPLLNRNGEVVGVVSSLLNPTRENFFIGIGFAVTIETAGGALGIPPW